MAHPLDHDHPHHDHPHHDRPHRDHPQYGLSVDSDTHPHHLSDQPPAAQDHGHRHPGEVGGGHAPRPDHGHSPHAHGHDGEHGHSHDEQGWWGRLRHAVSGAVGGHSHDTADQIDDALEADSAGRRALVISLIGLSVTALLQLIVVVISGSIALLGDTLHNVADALTAVPLLIAFTLVRRPPTKKYTYGYGRAEDIGGLFVIAMMLLSSVLAAYEAIYRLLHPQQVYYLWAVAAAGLVGFVGNEIVARYRIRVGRQIGSAALVADGLHARTDGFTSLAVLLGAGGVALGWQWADPIVGLLITVAILGVLRSAVRQVGARLMDAVDPGLVDQATAAMLTVDGVTGVRELRIRWIGHTLRAEADVTVDPALSVGQAHDLAHHAEQHLLADVRRLAGATIHISPTGAHSGRVRNAP
ncbi:MAG: cation diffusion facilitator family transporter [Actinomycetota bacterium]|nr:cation diffusion facilitator family transporter [Actinomycetota bacterium]